MPVTDLDDLDVLDVLDVGPPPLRRAVTGLLLGLAAGAVSALLLPREGRSGPGDALR